MHSEDETFENCCHRHAEPRYCNCSGNYGREAPNENSSKAILIRLVRTAKPETVRTTLRKLPERLPFPIKPGEPDWGKIGWEHFENLDVNKVIWERWFPPVMDRDLLLEKLQNLSDDDIDTNNLDQIRD